MVFSNFQHCITRYAIHKSYKQTLRNTRSSDNFNLTFQLGEGEESLNQIRECLKLDPEHKDCYPFYKKVKKVAKFLVAAQEAQNNQDWQECIDAAQKILKNEPKVFTFTHYQEMLRKIRKNKL